MALGAIKRQLYILRLSTTLSGYLKSLVKGDLLIITKTLVHSRNQKHFRTAFGKPSAWDGILSINHMQIAS